MKAEGFVKVLIDLEGEILGCHIVGPDASSLIQEVVVAMRPDPERCGTSARPSTSTRHCRITTLTLAWTPAAVCLPSGASRSASHLRIAITEQSRRILVLGLLTLVGVRLVADGLGVA